ncbi:MAG TPA: putative Ig domain-containing protein [Acidobacteriaceae bacterium]|nr:putative Ig domain-containing protein [Acidobacteriaceae bacterium]
MTASATTVDGTDTSSLTAVVAHDKNSAGVTWAVTGGGTLSGTTASAATYTAPAATSSTQTVTITATSVADKTKNGTATITVPADPAVTTASLAPAPVGTAYSVTLAGSGGIAPYSWALTGGTMPACLTLSSAGVISGTPVASCVGTASNLVFTLTDSGTPNKLTGASQQLSLVVNPAPAITFTSASLTGATYKVAYSASVAATGGAGTLTYTLASGTLPTGLSLSTAGVISGTPTETGTFPITVKAADAFDDSNTQVYSLKVTYPPLTVTAQTLPVGYVGSTYTQSTLAATGGSGTGYTWVATSALPTGLSLSTAGVISGKPSGSTGTISFTVKVTDSATNTGNGTFSIIIDAGVSITTGTTLPTGYVGSNYSQQLTATGGTASGYTWSVAGGSTLPGGLALSSGGLLSGKPTTTGTPSFSVTVTDSASNTTTVAFTMTIDAGVTITTTSLPSGYQGTAYPGANLAATGGTGSGYTWTWAAAGGSTLPPGLSLSSGGAISGTPTGSGTFNIVFTVSDSASNTASATISLTVEAKLAVSTTTLPSGTVGAAYSQPLAATGGSGGYTWTVDPTGANNLTAIGLSFSPSGVISGNSPKAGSASFTATVTDSALHTASANLSVSVFASLTVTTSTLPSTNVGVAYSQQLTAAGGTGTNYTWSVTAGAASLTAVNLSVSSAGLISGTPASLGTATFTVQVTDSASNKATANLTISVYSALSLPNPDPSSLPSTATTNVAYTGSIDASGGSGNYSWLATGLSDNLTASPSGGTLNINGTPTSASTVTFSVKLTDTTTGNSTTTTGYTITVSNPLPLTLPSPNPISLGSATVNVSYSGYINSSGGVSPYTWKINGTTVLSNGTPLALSNGLSASNTGGDTLTISGTPTTTTSVPLTNVTVTDSASTTAGPTSYSIAVNSAGSQVSGQIFPNNGCGGSSTMPPITVSINTNPVQTTTTDGNGNYSFATVPNGTYTITPSITGPSSVFYPATLTGVAVSNNAVSGENFSAALGYTVSGTASYSGSMTGQVYVNLNNINCGGNGGLGTSIPFSALSSGGAFTIHGVPPGTYTLLASIDNLGNGVSNGTNPTGSATVTVATANSTGTAVTLTDPTVAAPTSAPSIKAVEPANLGVAISYKPITNSNGVEMVTSYNVEWSTNSTFPSGSTSEISMAANGDKANVWILNNSTAGISGSFSNGTAYYFRAQGVVAAGVGPWKVFGSPTAVTIGQPSGSGFYTVSGTAVIPSNITPTGPLYVGLYDQSSNTAYSARIANPTNTSGGNAFTVDVPAGANYFLFGILDQNNNGEIDAGDVSNTNNNNNSSSVTITGNTTGENETLPDVNAMAAAQTQYNSSIYWNGSSSQTSTNYNINFDVREANKLPVSVKLVSASNPNVLVPMDIGNLCQGCGNPQFQLNANIASDVPVVNDTYTFDLTYSDGSTGVLTGTVTSVLGASALATSLAPQQTSSTSTTPTFTWTYPSNPSSYTYQFTLYGPNGNIWSIPGNNSNANGFTNTQIPGSLTWAVDPTDSTNVPTVSNLTGGTQYTWYIQSQDSNGNSAQASVWYQP